MDTTKRIYPSLPRWIAVIYGVLVVVTIPWIVYLAITLPPKQLSRHWDVAWVGLDIAIAFALILNAVFSYLELKWLVMSATATSTLLLTDAWFDVATAHAGRPFVESLASALLVELPLALLTFQIAVRIISLERVNADKHNV